VPGAVVRVGRVGAVALVAGVTGGQDLACRGGLAGGIEVEQLDDPGAVDSGGEAPGIADPLRRSYRIDVANGAGIEPERARKSLTANGDAVVSVGAAPVAALIRTRARSGDVAAGSEHGRRDRRRPRGAQRRPVRTGSQGLP
jgi:hypothetical protein